MTGQTTIDLSLLLLILSAIAQWVNIYFTNRKLKTRLSLEDQQTRNDRSPGGPLCAAATDMVAQHISLLATHTAELAAMKASIEQFRDTYDRGHASLESKMDNIQSILMSRA